VIIGFIGNKFFILGLFLAGMMIVGSFILPIKKGVVFAFQNRARMGYGRPFFYMIGLLPLAILLFVILYQTPLKVTSPCSVEPLDYTVVRSEAAGYLEKLLCDQGDRVKKDQVLAILKNDELQTQHKKLSINYTNLLQMKRKAVGLKKYVDYDQVEFEIRRTEKEIEKLKEKIEELKIRSPQNGIILTPNLKERVGDFLGEGEMFCEMGYLGDIQVRVIISEADFWEIQKGNRVDLKVYADAEKIFKGEVTDVSPVKVQSLENLALSSKFGGTLPTETATKVGEMPKLPYFQVTMKIGNQNRFLKPGMTGLGKIYGKKRPLITHIWSRLLRMIKPERILI
jgi:multidrug efflux pump subunit AcrA (membrane-fusion protein)